MKLKIKINCLKAIWIINYTVMVLLFGSFITIGINYNIQYNPLMFIEGIIIISLVITNQITSRKIDKLEKKNNE